MGNDGSFINAFQAGFTLVNSVRQQRLEERKLEQEKSFKEMDEKRKGFELEVQKANNILDSATTVLSNAAVPRKTKLGLYNQVVKPYMKNFAGVDTPDLPDWPDFGDDVMNKVAEIRKLKNVTPGDKLAMMSDLFLEHTSDFDQWLKTQQTALDPEKQPSVEQQQFSLLTDEEKRKAAVEKFKLDPDRKLTIKQVPFGNDQVAEVVIDEDSFDPKTGKINSYVLSIGGKAAVGSGTKTILEKGLPAETGGKLALVVSAMDRTDDTIIPLLFPGGKLDKQALLEGKTGTTARGRRLVAALSTLRSAILRPETGAAAPTQEQKDIASRLEPSLFFDSTESARANLEAAMNQLTGFAAIVDPDQRFRKTIRAEQKARKDKIGKASEGASKEELLDKLAESLAGGK